MYFKPRTAKRARIKRLHQMAISAEIFANDHTIGGQVNAKR